MPAPVWAAVVEVFDETKDERVLMFAEQVIRGEMLQTGDPALTLRNWLASSPPRSSGSEFQCERYTKTRNAIAACLEDRRITRMFARRIED
jgi:hypothetical protein